VLEHFWKKKCNNLVFRAKENLYQMVTVFHPATLLHSLILPSPQNQPGGPSVHKGLPHGKEPIIWMMRRKKKSLV